MSERDPRLQRRRPTDAELDQAAEITDLDIDAAIAQFDRDTAPQFRGLLEAETETDDGD